MGLIIGIIVLIAFLFFLFKFPKQMFVLIGILVFVCICIWYFAVSVPDQERKALQKNVVVTLAYDTSLCGLKYPLHVNITNKSNKTVNKISWHLNVYVPGYSSDLSGYNDDYSSDKILKPGEQCSNCYTLPSSLEIGNHSPSTLKYEVGWKSIDTD